MKLNRLKNQTFVFSIIFIFIALFLFSNFQRVGVIAQDAIENPGGWSWTNIFGWISGSCNTNYYGKYADYCKINVPKVLDINFDSNAVYLSSNIWYVKDNSGKNHIGTLSSAMNRGNIRNKTNNSNFDNALYFDGSYIDFGKQDDFFIKDSTDNFTISIWFKPDAMGTTAELFSNGDESNPLYRCFINPESKLSCQINNRIFTINRELSVNKWHNLTITYSNSVLSMYLDYTGTEAEIITNNITSFSSINKNLILGALINSSGEKTNFFRGEIDNFRFFRQALTSEQVLHNMQHNSNYSINIKSDTGQISGWSWSQGFGWMCFGSSCGLTPPDNSDLQNTKVYWSGDQANGIYPHMIKGWANVIQYGNNGFASLQGKVVSNNNANYRNCVSCVARDKELTLIGYYKFDENIGSVANDSSGKNYSGVLENFKENSWQDENCKINSCLIFSGESGVRIKEVEEINQSDFSVEAWIKIDNSAKDNLNIISSGKNWSLSYDVSNNQFYFTLFDKRITTQEKLFIFDNAWHHIFVSLDRNSEGVIYFDGKVVAREQIVDSADNKIEDKEWFIGKQEEKQGWIGDIDLVRIYKKSFSATDVEYNFLHPEKKYCSGCFNYIVKEGALEEIETKLLGLNTVPNNICYECQKCEYVDINSNETKCATCTSCRQYGLIFDTNTASIKGYAWAGSNIGWIKFSPSQGSGVYRSYISAKYGNIYSKSDIGSDYSITPPVGFYNASYLIQAGGRLINWSSEQSVITQGSTVVGPNFNPDKPWLNYFGNPKNYIAPKYEYPTEINNYGNILGSIDFNYLDAKAVSELPGKNPNNPNVCLSGGVYKSKQDTTLETKSGELAYKFQNGNNKDCVNGSGTIIIEGDLTIGKDANIIYEDSIFMGSSKNLASVAWIIKGDLIIDSSVTDLAGTFIVLGDSKIEDCGLNLKNPISHCGSIKTGESTKQLRISGQVIAKSFKFERTYRDALKGPSELIIYDGRNLINTPPGLGDVIKSLPRWDQIAPY